MDVPFTATNKSPTEIVVFARTAVVTFETTMMEALSSCNSVYGFLPELVTILPSHSELQSLGVIFTSTTPVSI